MVRSDLITPGSNTSGGVMIHRMRRRAALRRHLSVFAAVVALALTAIGCAEGETESSEPQPDDGPVIALNEISEAWPSAIVSGRLTERSGCLLIGEWIAVFPLGTGWEPPLITFRDGESVRVDNRVEMGGGVMDVDGLTQAGSPIVPVAEVRDCANRTGATQYAWAAPMSK